MAHHQLAHWHERKAQRLVSPRSGCGSPTDHHSGSERMAMNMCPATRLGSSANTGCQERRNTILPTCQRSRPAHLSNHHQGALGLRTGSPSDETWLMERTASGLSSGEGLIYAVRNSVSKWNAKEKIEEVIDPSVVDKRLMVTEAEFAGALSVMER